MARLLRFRYLRVQLKVVKDARAQNVPTLYRFKKKTCHEERQKISGDIKIKYKSLIIVVMHLAVQAQSSARLQACHLSKGNKYRHLNKGNKYFK